MGNPGRHPPIARFSRSLKERLARPAMARNRLLVTRSTTEGPGQAPSPSSKFYRADITSFHRYSVVGSLGQRHETECPAERRPFAGWPMPTLSPAQPFCFPQQPLSREP